VPTRSDIYETAFPCIAERERKKKRERARERGRKNRENSRLRTRVRDRSGTRVFSPSRMSARRVRGNACMHMPIAPLHACVRACVRACMNARSSISGAYERAPSVSRPRCFHTIRPYQRRARTAFGSYRACLPSRPVPPHLPPRETPGCLLTIPPALFLWLALSRARLRSREILRLSPPPLADYPFAVCCKFRFVVICKISKRLNYRRARGDTVMIAIIGTLGSERNGNFWRIMREPARYA